MAIHGTYIGNNRMFITPTWGGKLHALADDLSVTTDLLLQGYMELGLTNFLFQNLREGMNFVDVGANIGYFSIIAGYKVGQSGRLTAYEPNSKVHEVLIDNLTMNEIKRNVDIYKKGVYSDNKKIIFNISERFQGNSSLQSHSEQYIKDFKSDTFEQVAIDAVKLDTEDLGDFIHFLKVDVEGAEYHIFKGAEGRLQQGLVNVTCFELNKSMLQEDTEPFYETLKQYEDTRYGFALLKPDGEAIETTVDAVFEHEYIDNILMYRK